MQPRPAKVEIDFVATMKDARGRDVYLRLAQQADVILEGFRPGTTARLGVG